MRASIVRSNIRNYTRHTLFNVISFSLLSGNIITLLALRLEANNLLIGILSSFLYVAFLFMFVGRLLIRRFGAVQLMGTFWRIRYLSMVLSLLIPIPWVSSTPMLALSLLVLGTFGFHASKGIAMIGSNSIIGELFYPRIQGTILSRQQFLTEIIVIGMSILMAIVLRKDAPLYMYAVLIAMGILAGFVSSHYMFKFPEPLIARKGFGDSFWQSLKKGWQKESFRKLLTFVFMETLLVSMLTPFLVVYFKKVHDIPDGSIILFSAIGGIGAVLISWISSKRIDRWGPRTFLLFAAVGYLILIVGLVGSPDITIPWIVWLMGFFFFFLHKSSSVGAFNATQVYFYQFTKPEERLNFGLFFNFTRGVSGIVGATMGGFLLDSIQWIFQSTELEAFRIHFGIQGILVLGVVYIAFSMRGNHDSK